MPSVRGNHTEALLAEKEVRHFMAELERRILDAVHQELRGDPEAEWLVDDVARLIKTVLTRPTGIFVSMPELHAGAIVNLGENARQTERALRKLDALVSRQAGRVEEDAGPWNMLPMPRGAPPIEWGVKDGYLIVGVGPGVADGILQQTKTEPPAWLVEVRQQLAVPRPANLVYVDPEKIFDMLRPRGGPVEMRVIDALGLTDVRWFASATGLDESGCVMKSLIAIDGEPAGVFSLATAEPLSQEDLAVVTADATFAGAFRFDLARAFRLFLDMADEIDRGARDEITVDLAAVEEELRFRFVEHVFKAVGDVWRVYNSPGEGGWLVTGLTAVVDLRDRDRLAHANQMLVALAREEFRQNTQSAGRPRGITIDEFRFLDETVYHLKFVGDDVPIAPAWCITDDELVAALMPQNVKSYLAGKLSRGEGSGSLADVPEVARLFAPGREPLAVSYRNTPEIFRQVYPLLQFFAQVLCAELSREGVDIDVSILPSAPSILPHLQPGVKTVRRTKAGILIESRQTLPIGGGGGVLVLPWFLIGWRMSAPVIHDLPPPQTFPSSSLETRSGATSEGLPRNRRTTSQRRRVLP
ncbi:MAG: hypothetical protein ACYTG0_00270 [Planctomycetota bacterium]